MNERCPLLVNLRAGALHEKSGPEQLQRMARDAGLELEIIPTYSPEDLSAELKRRVGQGAEKVAIAGGDGTVALAVQELAHTQTALGILSLGTFNNFATALRLHHNLPAALRTLKDGVVRAVDLGKVGNRYFTETAGVGFFADGLALYGAGSNKNVLHGLYAGLRLALSFRPREIEVVVDGQSHPERVTLCEVANTYRFAQAVPIAPEANIEDGLLDVVVICDLRPREVLGYLRALRAQMHLGLPKVQVLRGREIIFRSHRRRNVHCDEKVIGVTPQTIQVQPGALRVLVDDRP
jgi:diacylglycerol kinase (ATP)